MIHELKIWPQYYERVKEGLKTFEVRLDDRGFQVGDTVILKEFNPRPVNAVDDSVETGYTGTPPLQFKIGYIFTLGMEQTKKGEFAKIVFSLIPSKFPALNASPKV